MNAPSSFTEPPTPSGAASPPPGARRKRSLATQDSAPSPTPTPTPTPSNKKTKTTGPETGESPARTAAPAVQDGAERCGRAFWLTAALRLNDAGVALLEADRVDDAQAALKCAVKAARAAARSQEEDDGPEENGRDHLREIVEAAITAADTMLSALSPLRGQHQPTIGEFSGPFLPANPLRIVVPSPRPPLENLLKPQQNKAISSVITYNLALSHHLRAAVSGRDESLEAARRLYELSEALLPDDGCFADDDFADDCDDEDGKKWQDEVLDQLGLAALPKFILNNATAVLFRRDGDLEGARETFAGLVFMEGLSPVLGPVGSGGGARHCGTMDVFELNAQVVEGMSCPVAA